MSREDAIRWLHAFERGECPWCGSIECWDDSVCTATGKRVPLDYEEDWPEFMVDAILTKVAVSNEQEAE